MASGDMNKEYVCTLSDERIKQAEEELFETAETRAKTLKVLRDKIEACPELNIRTDDAYLLRFLRAKKFDCERTFNLIMRHFEVKCEGKNQCLYSDMRPSAIKHVLEDGVTGVLAQRDKLGRKVVIFRPGRWTPSKYPVYDIFKTNYLTLSKLIQDEETQVSGIILLADLKGVGFGHLTHTTPFFIKRVVSLLQDSFPMRMKGVHYLNEPTLFDIFFTIARQFMKKKLLERIHLHGKDMSKLAEFIDVEHLPEDYGGKAPPFSNEDWKNTLLACDAEFDEEAKYGFTQTQTEEAENDEPKEQEEDVLNF